MSKTTAPLRYEKSLPCKEGTAHPPNELSLGLAPVLTGHARREVGNYRGVLTEMR